MHEKGVEIEVTTPDLKNLIKKSLSIYIVVQEIAATKLLKSLLILDLMKFMIYKVVICNGDES